MSTRFFAKALLLALMLAPGLTYGVDRILEDSDSRLITEVSGEYMMGDADTFMDAKRLAIEDAKRTAVHLAGTLIESETIMQDFEITKDEVRTFASAFIETELLGQPHRTLTDSGVLIVTVNVKATVDKEDMQQRISAKQQDPIAFRNKLAVIEQQNEKLKEQLALVKQQLSQTDGNPSQARQAAARREEILDLMAQMDKELFSPVDTIQVDLMTNIASLSQKILSETQKIADTTAQINRGIANLKKETSANPKKELANRGTAWSIENFGQAVISGDLETVTLFLQGGMDANSFHPDLKVSIPLLALTNKPSNNVELFQAFIDYGLNPNSTVHAFNEYRRERLSYSLLERAIHFEQEDVSTLLIELGADPDQARDFETL